MKIKCKQLLTFKKNSWTWLELLLKKKVFQVTHNCYVWFRFYFLKYCDSKLVVVSKLK